LLVNRRRLGGVGIYIRPSSRFPPWQVFSRGQDQDHRGLTPGFLEGVRHQRLVRGRAPRHRGVLLGAVSDVRAAAGRVGLTLAAPVKRGDGVVFDAGRPENNECGETDRPTPPRPIPTHATTAGSNCRPFCQRVSFASAGGVVYEVAKVFKGRPVVSDGEARPGERVYLRLGNETDLQGAVKVRRGILQ